jgi:diguanylate cyclase
MSNSKQHYHLLLKKIHCKEHEEIINKISEVIKPFSDEIATYFYSTMLANVRASYFINHDIVKKRLHKSMKDWINLSLSYKHNDEIIASYISFQLQVGHVHGRIDLPVSLVNHGMYLIKEKVSQILKNSAFERDKLADGLIILNQIFDIGLSLINESYQGDLVFNEKEAQAFKLQFSSQNLAFDCERLRASLSNWMRELLLDIHQENFDIAHTTTIRHSDFGLWVTHKSKLFLSNLEAEPLIKLLNAIDDAMISLIKDFSNTEKRKAALMALNVSVSKALWILDDIAKEIIAKDNGKDPLTRLFNRRYLDTVLRHETECSLKNDLIFGVMMLDIDFFKKINDSFGHDNGDRVLMQLAEVLTHAVRAGDFVFRLGGEEFLIILSDIDENILERVAQKLRVEVQNTKFLLNDDNELAITISIGVAIHNGHPDFQLTLKQADEALYKAKNNGRNRVEVAKAVGMTYADLDSLI